MKAVKIFALNIGDKFILNDKEYTITGFRQKRVPRLGKCLHCVTLCEGKVQMFLRNWEVKKL